MIPFGIFGVSVAFHVNTLAVHIEYKAAVISQGRYSPSNAIVFFKAVMRGKPLRKDNTADIKRHLGTLTSHNEFRIREILQYKGKLR